MIVVVVGGVVVVIVFVHRTVARGGSVRRGRCCGRTYIVCYLLETVDSDRLREKGLLAATAT